MNRIHVIRLVFLIVCIGAFPMLSYAEYQISKQEWAYYRTNLEFASVDDKLNSTYKQALQTLSEASKDTLRKEQRAWAIQREKDAFSVHGTKGNPYYLRFLIDAAQARERELRQSYLEKIQRPSRNFAGKYEGRSTDGRWAGSVEKFQPQGNIYREEKVDRFGANKNAASAHTEAEKGTKRKNREANTINEDKPKTAENIKEKSSQELVNSNGEILLSTHQFFKRFAMAYAAAGSNDTPKITHKIETERDKKALHYFVHSPYGVIEYIFNYRGNMDFPKMITFSIRIPIDSSPEDRLKKNILMPFFLTMMSVFYADYNERDIKIPMEMIFQGQKTRVWTQNGLKIASVYDKETGLFGMVFLPEGR